MSPFEPSPRLTRSTTLAVACALSAATASALGFADRLLHTLIFSGLISGITTWIAGYAWAHTVQRRREPLRARWSVAFAAGNAAIASCIVAFARGMPPSALSAVGMLLAGATVGVMIWGPALLLTSLLLGRPLAYSRVRALEGLSGAQAGERAVGIACALVSCLALAFTPSWWGVVRLFDKEPLMVAGTTFMHGMAVLGITLGTAVAVWATVLEHRRRRFVRAAETGALAGYRIQSRDETRVLVRVTQVGEGYREGPIDEPLCELDARGRAIGRLV